MRGRREGEGEMRVHRIAAERAETKCTGIYPVYIQYTYIYPGAHERRRRKLEEEREKEREWEEAERDDRGREKK